MEELPPQCYAVNAIDARNAINAVNAGGWEKSSQERERDEPMFCDGGCVSSSVCVIGTSWD